VFVGLFICLRLLSNNGSVTVCLSSAWLIITAVVICLIVLLIVIIVVVKVLQRRRVINRYRRLETKHELKLSAGI